MTDPTARRRSQFIEAAIDTYTAERSTGPDEHQLELQRVTKERTGRAAGMQIGDHRDGQALPLRPRRRRETVVGDHQIVGRFRSGTRAGCRQDDSAGDSKTEPSLDQAAARDQAGTRTGDCGGVMSGHVAGLLRVNCD